MPATLLSFVCILLLLGRPAALLEAQLGEAILGAPPLDNGALYQGFLLAVFLAPPHIGDATARGACADLSEAGCTVKSRLCHAAVDGGLVAVGRAAA